MSTDSILLDISDERWRQDKKWGVQNHSPSMWITILTEEVGEAAAEALELEWIKLGVDCHEPASYYAKLLREELIQVAAVAVAAIECLDREVIE